MKKCFFAIMTLMMMVIAAPKVMAMPDDTTDAKIEAALASMNDEDRLKVMVEMMSEVLTEEEDSPFDALWIDDEYNAVVMSMKVDADVVESIESLPTTFKHLMMNEMFSGDEDMVDFAHLIGRTGRELDLFFHTADSEKKAIIEISPEELLDLK